jgi:AcrR family transcriptional regulator
MRSRSVGRPPTFTEVARREQIVGCAIEVIADLGYPQASIRKIAERVGVAMSVVLYHFATKDDLVEAVIEEMYRSALAVLTPAVDGEPTATGKLNAYIRASLQYFDTRRVHLVALAELASGYRPRSGRRFDELGLSDDLREQLAALDPAAIFRLGQRNREFRKFAVDSMAIALRAVVNATAEQVMRDPDFDVRRYGEDLLETFGRAVQSTR